MALSPVAVIGAIYTASERGLSADVLAARALGLAPLPLCTSIVVASGGRVTDVTDVPVDTVIAQLEHLAASGPLARRVLFSRSAEVLAQGSIHLDRDNSCSRWLYRDLRPITR